MEKENNRRYEKIKKLIKEYNDFQFCGPSSDPDGRTLIIYSFKDIVERIKYHSDYLNSENLKTKIKNINLEFDNITEAYEVYTKLNPIIDDIERYINNKGYEADIVGKSLDELDFEYISEQINKCRNKIENEDYDGAITNARTLVESVCLCLLDEADKEIPKNGNLGDYYDKVSKLLRMDPKIYDNESLRDISQAFITIINRLANLRNELSDAHGKSKNEYYKPSHRHAILAVNSAKTISEYIYNSWNNRKSSDDK